ncbi:putative disease resistance protein RGA3 isoform X2 [Oryza brachyantha]|nr:putative disease resistance protein RGA3 isoform X2 [Oryza brachyantha]
MDTFSAVLGDLLSRCISFAIDRCHQQHQGVEEEGNLQRLRRVLLRIQAVVEEADGRCITNRVMLQQLSTLRDAMYRGCYFLDNSRCRTIQAHATYEVGDHSPGLSPFSPLKRLCISTGAWKILPRAVEKNELQRMLDHLETVVSDMQEFVVFVSSYPRVPRQPYCSYLLLENCMFGRQAEQERVIKFLLEPRPPGAAKGIDVLPIIGPGGVGKSTLVEHVCFDERVRRCFSTIVYYGPDSIRGGSLTVLADTGMIKHRNPVTTEQSLVIIEPGNDMDDETWRGILHSLRDGHITTVSKIIITSRSKEMATFGTTEALQLDFLTKEAFWYFFKTIVFGSTNPEEEPKLASICMELATMVDGSFMGAHIFGDILR